MPTIWCFVFLLAAAGSPPVAAAPTGQAAATPADARQAMAALLEEAYRLARDHGAEMNAAGEERRALNLDTFAPVIAKLEQAVALSASRRTADSPLPANDIMLELADIYEMGEDWPRAEQWRRRQLAELTRLDFADGETAAVVVALAQLRDRQGDTKGGDALAARAAKLIEGKPAPEPVIVIHTLTMLADRELDRERRASAESYAARAYAKAQAQDDLPQANLVSLLELTRRLRQLLDEPLSRAPALPLLERELVLVQRLDAGEELVEFARWNLITHLIRQNRRDDTVPYLKQQIEASERQGRTVSFAYATAVHTLTSINMERGDLASAVPYWQRLADLCVKVLGPRHPQTATTLEDLALLQQLAGQSDAAAQTRRRRAVLEIDPNAKPLVDDAQVARTLSTSLRPFLQHIEHAASTRKPMREADEFGKNLEKSQRRRN